MEYGGTCSVLMAHENEVRNHRLKQHDCSDLRTCMSITVTDMILLILLSVDSCNTTACYCSAEAFPNQEAGQVRLTSAQSDGPNDR